MTRSVADAALMMQVLARPDERDHMSLPPQAIAWQSLDRDVRGLRLGLLLEAGVGLAGGPEGRGAGEGAARRFEGGGAPGGARRPLPPRAERGGGVRLL